MNGFAKGLITGAAIALALGLVIGAFRFFHNRDRKIYEMMEEQIELQELREDYGNRDPYEFLDDIPGVRGAADRGIEGIRRKRDEILQRRGSAGND